MHIKSIFSAGICHSVWTCVWMLFVSRGKFHLSGRLNAHRTQTYTYNTNFHRVDLNYIQYTLHWILDKISLSLVRLRCARCVERESHSARQCARREDWRRRYKFEFIVLVPICILQCICRQYHPIYASKTYSTHMLHSMRTLGVAQSFDIDTKFVSVICIKLIITNTSALSIQYTQFKDINIDYDYV